MPPGSPGSPTQIIGIIAASVLVLAFGTATSIYFGRKARSSADWLAARDALPLGVVIITQFATATGGGVLIAHVGIGYAAGWSVFVYEGCVLLGFLLLMLIAKWIRQQRFTTIPEIVTHLFTGSRLGTAIAALAALVVPFGWLATQFVAFADLFSRLTGIPNVVLVLVIMLASLLFVLPGGLLSVAWTDFVFGLFMIIMSLAVAYYAVRMAGGWRGITSAVPRDLWSWHSITAAGSEQIWLWIAAIVPGTLTNQLYFQRIFATKHVRHARRGLALSGVTMLLGGVYAGCIGLAVHAMNPGLASPEHATGWLLPRLPTGVLIAFGAFLVSTIVSTTGSALHSVVANLTRDVYQNLANNAPSDRHVVRLSRLISVAVAMLAAALAVLFPTALDWLVATYAYSASALVAPLFLGYALRERSHLTSTAAITSMLAGVVGCAGAHLADTTVPYAVYGIGASALALVLCASASTRWRNRTEKHAVARETT